MKNLFKFSDFLINRKNRYKPREAEKLILKRIDKIDFKGNIFLSDKKSNTEMILVKSGDLVISGINVEKGAVAVYTDKDDVLATIHYSSFQYNPKIIDIDYLKLLLKSPQFKKLINSLTNNGIKKEIKPKHLLSLEILLPSIDEQKTTLLKVNEILEQNVLLENIQLSQIKDISTLRQSILQDAIQGKLVPQDPNDEPAEKLLEKIKDEKEKLIKDGKIKKEKPTSPISPKEIPFELPNGWMWSRFKEIAHIASNLVSPNKYLDYNHIAPNNIEKFTGKLLPYQTVDDDKVTSINHLFNSGQILYSKIRPNLSKVVIIDFDGLCSADMYPIDSYIYPRYLYIYMLSTTFLSIAIKKDTRVAMPKINQEELNKITVPIPPLNEQKRIVEKVESLMKICDEQEKNLTEAKDSINKLNQAILSEVFRGEL